MKKNEKANISASYNDLIATICNPRISDVGTYRIESVVGEGSFGKVYLAAHLLTNTKVVLKSSCRKQAIILAREIHHHRRLLHPNITRLYEVVCTEDRIYLAMEYCPNGELYDWVAREKRLDEKTTCRIMWQLCCAIQYLHRQGCVHRDLKLENIFLDKAYNVKLGDFGFSRDSDCSRRTFMNTRCGTVAYCAPELVQGHKYIGECVDIWSLGIIMYALLIGRLPFDEDDVSLTEQKIINECPQYPETLSKNSLSLLKSLLCKDYRLRPSIDQIISHPYFKENGYHSSSIRDPRPSSKAEEKVRKRLEFVGVDMDQLNASISQQRCDMFYGWWLLLLEKEMRKENKKKKGLFHLHKGSSSAVHIAPATPSLKTAQVSVMSNNQDSLKSRHASSDSSNSLLSTFRSWLFDPKQKHTADTSSSSAIRPRTPSPSAENYLTQENFDSDNLSESLDNSVENLTVFPSINSFGRRHSNLPQTTHVDTGEQNTPFTPLLKTVNLDGNKDFTFPSNSQNSPSKSSNLSINIDIPPSPLQNTVISPQPTRRSRTPIRSLSGRSSVASSRNSSRTRSYSNVSSASSNSLISIISSKPSSSTVQRQTPFHSPFERLHKSFHFPSGEPFNTRINATAIFTVGSGRKNPQSSSSLMFNQSSVKEEEEPEETSFSDSSKHFTDLL